MTLENITPEEQLTLNHIDNLKKAAEMSHGDILYLNGGKNAVTVTVDILEDKREVEIKFSESEWEPETTTLRDYTYLMSVLFLG